MVQARVIPSGSMENTLLVGDHLLMSRLGYDAGVPFTHYHVRLWREPHRQQVIIFHAPIPGTDEDFIKRLIGLPGDMVEIRRAASGFRQRRKALVEPYRNGPPYSLDPRDDNYGPVTSPGARNYFVKSATIATIPTTSRYLGLRPGVQHHRHARDNLHVRSGRRRRLAAGPDSRTLLRLCECDFAPKPCAVASLIQDVLASRINKFAPSLPRPPVIPSAARNLLVIGGTRRGWPSRPRFVFV